MKRPVRFDGNAPGLAYLMSFIETVDRTRRSKLFVDDMNPRKRATFGTLCPLHYEMSPGEWADVDCTAQRINNAVADGWRVTTNAWHYFVGRDLAVHGTQDGWIGFGGKGGNHWFKFRLLRSGYLRGSDRTWQDMGGAPTYNRAKLTRTVISAHVRRLGVDLPISSVASWSDIWTTPGGGSLSIKWLLDGQRLKEEVTINQAGRNWITANRPPSFYFPGTPLTDVWFGFVFQIDWSDVPRVYRQDTLQNISDFSDDGNVIALRDEQDDLLAFLPVDDLIVYEAGTRREVARVPLLKRFWLDDDGNHYLALGVRCDVLAGLPAGDLAFDPTVDAGIGASANDGYSREDASTFSNNDIFTRVGLHSNVNRIMNSFHLWTGITAAGTINVCEVDVRARNDATPYAGTLSNILTKFFFEKADNPSAVSSAANHNGRTRTTSGTNFFPSAWAQNTWYTINVTAAMQELVDTYTISGDNVQGLWDDSGTAVTINYIDAESYNAAPASAAQLYIEYTVAGGAGILPDSRRARFQALLTTR